jgi:hypothetical protein
VLALIEKWGVSTSTNPTSMSAGDRRRHGRLRVR